MTKTQAHWIGREETQRGSADLAPLQGLAALFDYEAAPWPPGKAPPLAHWLYCQPHDRQSELDHDGHLKRGGFLPAIDLPRRMWAGSRVRFLAPVCVGADLVRHSVISAVTEKSGATGPMVFVTTTHSWRADDVVAIAEEQDLVFVGGAARTSGAPDGGGVSDFDRPFAPDAVQLFRYSALTFNAHRIHYDRDYVRDVEGYPNLVVHGPYIATALLDHAARYFPTRRPTAFSFRARAPLFQGEPARLRLRETATGANIWCEGDDQRIRTLAQVEFAP